MESCRRYAVYFTPPPGPLADFGAAWLGWDMAEAREVPGPDLPALPVARDQITAQPRRYGLHATLKAPFRLAPGADAAALLDAIRVTAAGLPALVLTGGLELADLSDCLALVPARPQPALDAMAAHLVEELDLFRAPLTPADHARRNPARLTPRQRALLDRWGYPFTHDQFGFHITLTGPLPDRDRQATRAALAPLLSPLLADPFPIASLTLAGEDSNGMFRELARVALRRPAIAAG